jgi:hypothetical protein
MVWNTLSVIESEILEKFNCRDENNGFVLWLLCPLYKASMIALKVTLGRIAFVAFSGSGR